MAATSRATDRGDSPRGALLADERLERASIERLDGASLRGGKRDQRRADRGVTVERVIGEPSLDAEMIQIGVDHSGRAMLTSAVS